MNDNPINFFSEEIDFQLSDSFRTTTWILKVIQAYKKIPGDINYIFCSDNYLLEKNISYLNHDTYTDIITFDNSDEEHLIEGDIYISIDRVKENAVSLKNAFNEELHRVIIHGILHLIGYEDNTAEKKQEMRDEEQTCLSMMLS